MSSNLTSVNVASFIEKWQSPHTEKMVTELAFRKRVVVAVESGFFLLFSVTGLVGNLCVCSAVRRNRTIRRKPTNIIVAALAVSDVLMCALVAPLSFTVLIKNRWIFGEEVCRFQGTILYSLSGISLYLISLMAINRYFCVVKPEQYNTVFNTKSTILYAIAVWFIISSIMVILHATKWLDFYFHPFKATCVVYIIAISPLQDYLANMLSGTVLVAVPFIILSTLYFKIFRHIWSHQNRVTPSLQNSNNQASTSPSLAELKMTRTVFVIVVGYVSCWLPVLVIDVVSSQVHPWYKTNRHVGLLWTFFGLMSSMFNPWIIVTMNRTFQQEIRKIFSFKC